jgi:hypothetical protein
MEDEVAGYNIYRSEEAGVYPTVPLNGSTLVTVPSFTDSTVQKGRTYYYAVTAVTPGGEESSHSNEVQAVVSPGIQAPPVKPLTTGHRRTRPQTGGLAEPSLALVGYHPNGVFVSETAFPASPPIRNGRIFTAIQGPVTTGVAISNPNTEPVPVDFYFTDGDGATLHSGSTSIPSNGKLSAFLNESPFLPPNHIQLSGARTFTFSAALPIAVTAIRAFTSERSQFLMTQIPVVELQSAASPPITLPYYVDGAGWDSEVQLVNPTGSVLSGTVQFFPTLQNSGPPAPSPPGSEPDFPYTIPPRAAVALRTKGVGLERRTGWIRVTPAGTPTPSGSLIFSYRTGGVTVSQAALHGTIERSGSMIYVEASGAFPQREPGSIQTALAISNPASTTARIDLEAFGMDGTTVGTGSLTVAANSQTITFPDQIPGIQGVRIPFNGFIRIGGAPVTVLALKGRYNDRGQVLFTPIPSVAESTLTSPAERFLYFADGGEYTTQFITFLLPRR